MDPNDRLDPTPFFADRQLDLLQDRLDRGSTLVQRRAEGRWVERRRGGIETELTIRDHL